MASYAAPTGEQILDWTGLNTYIRDDAAPSFASWLESLLENAEAEVAVAVGEDEFDGSDWTDRRAKLLTLAVAYYVAAAALVSSEVTRVTGTYEPYNIDDPTEIAETAERLRALGREKLGIATQGTGAPATTERPFARPSARSSTFAGAPEGRTPAERNALLDERDGIGSWDTVNG